MDLAHRLQALEDIEAIKRLKYDYFYYCDTKQPDKMRQCFVDGPVHIDYGRVGIFSTGTRWPRYLPSWPATSIWWRCITPRIPVSTWSMTAMRKEYGDSTIT